MRARAGDRRATCRCWAAISASRRSERQWDFIGAARREARAAHARRCAARWQLKNASCGARRARRGRRPPAGLAGRGEARPHAGAPARAPAGAAGPARDRARRRAQPARRARARRRPAGDMGFFENTIAVFAMLGDKDIGGVIDAMRGRIDRWFVATRAEPSARPAPAQLVEALADARPRRGHAHLRDGRRARSMRRVGRRGRMIEFVVFGSFYHRGRSAADRCARPRHGDTSDRRNQRDPPHAAASA